MPDPTPEPTQQPPREAPSNRVFVIGFLFAVVLAVAGIVLVKALVDMVKLQNCAITGRTTC